MDKREPKIKTYACRQQGHICFPLLDLAARLPRHSSQSAKHRHGQRMIDLGSMVHITQLNLEKSFSCSDGGRCVWRKASGEGRREYARLVSACGEEGGEMCEENEDEERRARRADASVGERSEMRVPSSEAGSSLSNGVVSRLGVVKFAEGIRR